MVPGAGLVCAGVGAALVAGAGLMVGVWVAVGPASDGTAFPGGTHPATATSPAKHGNKGREKRERSTRA